MFEKQINKMGYTFTNLQFLLTNEKKMTEMDDLKL